MRAWVLIKVPAKRIGALIEELRNYRGIVEAAGIYGETDVIAKLEVPDQDALDELVVQQIQSIDAVESTRTFIAIEACTGTGGVGRTGGRTSRRLPAGTPPPPRAAPARPPPPLHDAVEAEHGHHRGERDPSSSSSDSLIPLAISLATHPRGSLRKVTSSSSSSVPSTPSRQDRFLVVGQA